MKRVLFIAALLSIATPAAAQACSGCGCRGGPGYRGPNGQCVGWEAMNRVCGTPPTTRCKPEQVNARLGKEKAAPKSERPEAAPRRQPPSSTPNTSPRPNPF